MKNRVKKVITALSLAGLFAISSVAARPVSAQATLPIGSVDVAKIQSGYAKRAQLEKTVADLNFKLSSQLKTLSASDMLNKDQLQQLAALLAKQTLTDPEKAKVAELQNASARDSQELTALQQKANPSDDDKKRLGVLAAQKQAAQDAMQQIVDGYNEQFKLETQKVSDQFTELVKSTVAAVAKDKGLTVVLDSQLAIYCANDITDEVLKRLNK